MELCTCSYHYSMGDKTFYKQSIKNILCMNSKTYPLKVYLSVQVIIEGPVSAHHLTVLFAVGQHCLSVGIERNIGKYI